MASLVQNNNEHSLTSPEQKCTGELGALAGDKSLSLPRTADFGKSIIIDETTDISTTSQLAVLGVYFNKKDFRLEIILIDLIPLKDGTATTIYTSLLESLGERGIPMHVIGFCADTCNVMFGANHSVSQLLGKTTHGL
jgi:hypothetical protein